MTNTPPPDPKSSQRTTLGFDEFIGILVAFSVIGTILFWSISRRSESWNFTSFLSPLPSPSVQPNQGLNLTDLPLPSADVQPTATPTPQSPLFPALVPTPTPEAKTPSPSPTPIPKQIPVVVPLPMIVPGTPPPIPSPTGQPLKFVDVPNDFWARPFIDDLSARGIVRGFPGDYFRPNQPVTRAEFAAIVKEAFDNKPGKTTTVFKDVPAKFWANPAINRTTKIGFLKGYPGNIFRPQQKITKAQVLVALASGLNLTPPSYPGNFLRTYQDAKQIPKYATGKIAAATAAGIVVNQPNPNVLNPNRNATRAEVAAIVYQALVKAGKAAPIPSQYIVRSPQ